MTRLSPPGAPPALIAHRAGNSPRMAQRAAAVAAAVELDVHLFRGRLEVRHSKVLWPFSRLWEPGLLLPHSAPRPSLASTLDALPPDVELWIDLKGPSPRLAKFVLEELRRSGRLPQASVSARSWWILDRVRSYSDVPTYRSVGTWWQRWLADRWLLWVGDSGIVIHERLLTAAATARLRSVAPHLVAWGVTDRDRANVLRTWGVDGLILEDLDLIAELRRADDAST